MSAYSNVNSNYNCDSWSRTENNFLLQYVLENALLIDYHGEQRDIDINKIVNQVDWETVAALFEDASKTPVLCQMHFKELYSNQSINANLKRPLSSPTISASVRTKIKISHVSDVTSTQSLVPCAKIGHQIALQSSGGCEIDENSDPNNMSVPVSVGSKKRGENVNPRPKRRSRGLPHKPSEYNSWTKARRRLWDNVGRNPNQYYLKYVAPGRQLTSPEEMWTHVDIDRFIDDAISHPPKAKWGLFSLINFPSKTGNDCFAFFTFLREYGIFSGDKEGRSIKLRYKKNSKHYKSTLKELKLVYFKACKEDNQQKSSLKDIVNDSFESSAPASDDDNNNNDGDEKVDPVEIDILPSKEIEPTHPMLRETPSFTTRTELDDLCLSQSKHSSKTPIETVYNVDNGDIAPSVPASSSSSSSSSSCSIVDVRHPERHKEESEFHKTKVNSKVRMGAHTTSLPCAVSGGTKKQTSIKPASLSLFSKFEETFTNRQRQYTTITNTKTNNNNNNNNNTNNNNNNNNNNNDNNNNNNNNDAKPASRPNKKVLAGDILVDIEDGLGDCESGTDKIALENEILDKSKLKEIPHEQNRIVSETKKHSTLSIAPKIKFGNKFLAADERARSLRRDKYSKKRKYTRQQVEASHYIPRHVKLNSTSSSTMLSSWLPMSEMNLPTTSISRFAVTCLDASTAIGTNTIIDQSLVDNLNVVHKSEQKDLQLKFVVECDRLRSNLEDQMKSIRHLRTLTRYNHGASAKKSNLKSPKVKYTNACMQIRARNPRERRNCWSSVSNLSTSEIQLSSLIRNFIHQRNHLVGRMRSEAAELLSTQRTRIETALLISDKDKSGNSTRTNGSKFNMQYPYDLVKIALST